MASDISKVRITGPCQVVFKGVDMGHTLDGIELTGERDFARVKTDKAGDTPIDYILTGNRVKVKFKLAQNGWDQWNMAIPETSSYDGAGVKDRNDFGADAGASLRAEAGVLFIHPLALSLGDPSQDLTIYLAVSTDNVTLPMKIDEQAVIEVTMEALYSEAYGSGRRLGHYGPADVS